MTIRSIKFVLVTRKNNIGDDNIQYGMEGQDYAHPIYLIRVLWEL